MTRLSKTVLACFIITVAVAPYAVACDVPVFRYAMERWKAEPYRCTVFHRGNLGESDKQAVDILQKAADRGTNITVTLVDIDKPLTNPELAPLRPAATQKLPYLVVTWPASLGNGLIWSAALSASSAKEAIESPMRSIIAGELTAGHTGVWVIVEGKDASANDRAAKNLTDWLSQMPNKLKLPVMDESSLAGAPNAAAVRSEWKGLRIDFPLLRLSRDNAAEAVLLSMLLKSESDLVGLTDEPMVFAIFGRGRMMDALVGDGINLNNVESICKFFVGPCACVVRPGRDLLFNTNWDNAVSVPIVSDTVALPEVISSPSDTQNPEKTRAKSEPVSTPPYGGILLWTSAIVAAMTLVAVLIIRRTGRKRSGK